MTFRNRMTVALAVFATVALCTTAVADPVDVQTEQDEIQDDWTVNGRVEELGTSPHSDTQLISSAMVEWVGHIPCPSEYENETAGTTVQVQITNLTNRFFPDLYYVGDSHDGGLETTFTNYDEWIHDLNGPFFNPGMAFKIDSVGVNTPLVFESMTPDQIFEPNEVWEFVVQEYSNQFGLPASALASVGPAPLGAVAEASWFGLDTQPVSAASIITPEPGTLAMMLGAGAVGLVLLARKRRRQ